MYLQRYIPQKCKIMKKEYKLYDINADIYVPLRELNPHLFCNGVTSGRHKYTSKADLLADLKEFHMEYGSDVTLKELCLEYGWRIDTVQMLTKREDQLKSALKWYHSETMRKLSPDERTTKNMKQSVQEAVKSVYEYNSTMREMKEIREHHGAFKNAIKSLSKDQRDGMLRACFNWVTEFNLFIKKM